MKSSYNALPAFFEPIGNEGVRPFVINITDITLHTHFNVIMNLLYDTTKQTSVCINGYVSFDNVLS